MSSATVSSNQEEINANIAKESYEIKQRLEQMNANKKSKVHKKSLNRKTSSSSSESYSPSKSAPFVLDRSKIKEMDAKELKNMIDEDDDNERETQDDLTAEKSERPTEVFDPELSDEDIEIIPPELRKTPVVKPISDLKKAEGVPVLVEDDQIDDNTELDILDSDDEKPSK